MNLTLNLRAEYFYFIQDGRKRFEFRLCTAYWKARIEGKVFDKIILKLGYPKKGDKTRIIERPWRGSEIQTITHPEFGDEPVEVYAIRVNEPKEQT